MKKFKKLIFNFANLTILFTSPMLLANISPTVNFKLKGIHPETKEYIYCNYNNMFKERPAPKEGNPTVPYIEFSTKTIESNHDHATCQSIINNFTRLDEVQSQREIAKIIKEIDCMPGVPIEIYSESTIEENAKKYHSTKNANFIWNINLLGCLEDAEGKKINVPYDCHYPSDGSPLSSQIDYDQLITFFKTCRDAINKKVSDEKLLDKWLASNDPNKPRRRTNH